MTSTGRHDHDDDDDDDATVVLDIGGDVGALIVFTGVELLGVEIEISPLDVGAEDVFQAEHPHHAETGIHTHDGRTHEHTPGTTHVAVRERRSAGLTQYAAVYPGLRAGRYAVWRADGSKVVATIAGGEVTELDWR